MTSYRDAWNSHRQRIDTVWQMAELHSRLLSLAPAQSPFQNRDIAQTARLVLNECRSVCSALIEYSESFRGFLPTHIAKMMDAHLDLCGQELEKWSHDQDQNTQSLAVNIPFRLKSLESDVSHLLSDTQESIRFRSERAFSHLQRLIVVDPSVRTEWKNAFLNGETACEKKGAVHLLWHGIYAFKANAEGARTDLVYAEPVDRGDPAVRSAEGLILTEWKKATSTVDAAEKFRLARGQGVAYARGILAENELRDYAYAIVVTNKAVQLPDECEENGLTWRHINIAVDPETPSRMRFDRI